MVRRRKKEQGGDFTSELVNAGKDFVRGIWHGMGPDPRKREEPRRRRGRKA